MPASHPLSWRRSSAERGKSFDGATRCNTCGPMETQLAAYWLASGDLYLFRRLSEDLALASTVLVLIGTEGGVFDPKSKVFRCDFDKISSNAECEQM